MKDLIKKDFNRKKETFDHILTSLYKIYIDCQLDLKKECDYKNALISSEGSNEFVTADTIDLDHDLKEMTVVAYGGDGGGENGADGGNIQLKLIFSKFK